MSDEQATIMIGLLTEIRDELRLVRSTVVIDDKYGGTLSPSSLSKKLYDISLGFERSRYFDGLWSLPLEEFDTALEAAYQRF